MEQSSRKKVLSFKGSGSALRVTFEGTLIPGIIEVMSELRDAGSLVTDHPLIIDFKELTVSQNWLRSSALKIVTTPLRSGQSLFHEGDVLMLGNLHSGAEINATGSIIVLGSLLGQVHAGCAGDNSASVVTMSYQTNQMRIGTMISNAMEPGASPWWGRPVRIYVQGGVFVASEIARPKER